MEICEWTTTRVSQVQPIFTTTQRGFWHSPVGRAATQYSCRTLLRHAISLPHCENPHLIEYLHNYLSSSMPESSFGVESQARARSRLQLKLGHIQ
jgi:hypothetical protein